MSLKSCPHCSQQIPAEANYCPYCTQPTGPSWWVWLRANYPGLLAGIILTSILAMVINRCSPTPTDLVQPTSVRTSTPTLAASDTPVPTASATATSTVTASASPTSTPTQTLTFTPTVILPPTQAPDRTSAKDGMVQVNIPEGWFRMGSGEADGEADDNEKPQHDVYLDSFWIDQTEVTNRQYAQCVAAGACTEPREKKSLTRARYYGNPLFADYPVVYVTWSQASAYCKWAERRLPSEAEWEKAARGSEVRIYPWGDIFDGSLLNYCDAECWNGWRDNNFNDGYTDTAPVGSYPDGKSIYGVFNLSGNAYEWVADWYAVYTGAPLRNPTGPVAGTERVLRGGSWGDDTKHIRVAVRSKVQPGFSENFLGFRCAE